jgi:cellulose synthase operon protein C
MKQIFTFSPSKTLAILLLGSVHVASPAFAQSMPSNEDLRALRFYVENNEQAAIDAELRRLKGAFPGWTPPSDLSNLMQTQPTTEVADIYARLARGDIEGVRRVMQSTKARFPSWEPPADLARQIDLVEAQNAFDRAVNTRNADEALRIGKRVPALFRCDRINNAWNLAELQAASGNPSRALAAYNQTVRTCTTIPDLVATIEKADSVTSEAQLNSLVDVAKQRFPAHSATFNALNERLLAGRGSTRRTVVAAAPVPAPAAAPTPTVVSPKRADPAPAVRAPAPVVQAAPIERSVQGGPSSPLTSLPRTGDGRLNQARAAKDAKRFDDCLAYSVRPGSMDLAYERAWCAYNLDRSLESMAFFSAAARAGLGATVTRDAQFGLILSMLKRNMTENAADLASRVDLTSQQRYEVEIIILDQRGVSAYNKKEYAGAIEYFNALEQSQGSLRRDLAIMRGYAYLNIGERARARALFQGLHDSLATKETAAALKATY